MKHVKTLPIASCDKTIPRFNISRSMDETIELEYTLFSISISVDEIVEKSCIIILMTVPVMPPIYV